MDEEFYNEELQYYKKDEENRDYIFRTTVCQFILCVIFLGCIFGLSFSSETAKEKLAQSIDYLQSQDISREIEAVKEFLISDAEI